MILHPFHFPQPPEAAFFACPSILEWYYDTFFPPFRQPGFRENSLGLTCIWTSPSFSASRPSLPHLHFSFHHTAFCNFLILRLQNIHIYNMIRKIQF